MSTFRGVMPEFPDIRVDFFRTIRDKRAPLACFLSHVHSDHLAGLESLKSPFVFCSAATRELLLRLERYPHRLNFALGVLESRKHHYKHLKYLLKPIPLETPTRIELSPGNDIQVTLFDANHCTGAVMFLFESDNKAVLYTGDIRSEPWFVNNLTRNPLLIEYTTGLKSLDCIYLDTSNTGPITFPTKADGLKELLEKVSNYPPDTVFHFTAWTFGYEEVWMALSRALKSKVHVDSYKLYLYQSLQRRPNEKSSLSGSFLAHDGPALAGYQCGNAHHAGCLTSDMDVRIHSCEKGMHCKAINEKTVWIRPIITRTKAGEVGEIGVGGGLGDLTQRPELELDDFTIDQFLGLFATTEDLIMQDIKRMLVSALRTSRKSLSLNDMGLDKEQDDLCLTDLIKVLARSVSEKHQEDIVKHNNSPSQGQILPKVITFPYSRHSSYKELCNLVQVFDPKDVYPCTANELSWTEDVSMARLFGCECSSSYFRHDEEMRELRGLRDEVSSLQTQTTVQSSQMLPLSSPSRKMADTPKKPTTFMVRRNSRGLLRPFDVFGNELSPSRDISDPPTPPGDVIALSPGSESQSRRRRFIIEGLRDDPAKRSRLSYDDYSSSPMPETESRDTIQAAREVGNELDEHIEDVVTLHSGDETDEEVFEPYWDSKDEVFRCGLCDHELWGPAGDCSSCAAGDCSYFEKLDPEQGRVPDVAYNDYDTDDMSWEARLELAGDYLDFESSAYDSHDEQSISTKTDNYEIDSFIDDTSQELDADKAEAASSDSETGYKEQFKALESTQQMLIHDYCDLLNEHEDLRREALGSTYDSDEAFDESDENAPDPLVTEVILSHANGESQESEVTPKRFNDRAKAYGAALNGSGWDNISLASTGNNHTHLEVEL